jgi:hypothetical protein
MDLSAVFCGVNGKRSVCWQAAHLKLSLCL